MTDDEKINLWRAHGRIGMDYYDFCKLIDELELALRKKMLSKHREATIGDVKLTTPCKCTTCKQKSHHESV